ncbi:hypothetical protein [Streptomyces sp. W1SF4]|uniref:hypothetical protein n=1 Tax=Streptomyces sp. W1SF4 TaxID=2305220 RepID=UPI000F71CC89|nr:hypothetical protein [Streptomyces sp. W1SF4]AZM91465.1 hypothetical protein D1J60_25770 [Streptomyces sp. W1SF4]
MRVRDLIRRFRGDQTRAAGVIAGQAVKIRDLEARLETAEAAVVKLMRGGGADIDRVGFLTTELERRARQIDQLRAGVVDDAQTAALRFALQQERAAVRALESRLAMLQAANDGISSPAVAA